MRFIYLFVLFVLCVVKIEFSFVLALRNKALLLSGILACPRQGQLESWPFPSWRVPAVPWRDELDSWRVPGVSKVMSAGVFPAVPWRGGRTRRRIPGVRSCRLAFFRQFLGGAEEPGGVSPA